MKGTRLMRVGALLAMGACVFQAGGCDLTVLNEFAQTVLLGVTAAGSIAILRNI